jgi:hypothetical protein
MLCKYVKINMHSTAVKNSVVICLKEKEPAVNASIPCDIILGNQRLMALPSKVKSSNSIIKPR